jgi:hypothetical protein
MTDTRRIAFVIAQRFRRLSGTSRAALAIGVTFVAYGVVEAVVSGGSGASAALACRSAQLSARLGRFGVAAGSVGGVAVLRNDSSEPCALEGYPGLRMLDRAGRRIPTHVHRGASMTAPAVAVRRVTLAPGGVARFHIGFTDMTGYGFAHCPVSARVAPTPPGAASAIIVPWQLQPYGGSAVHVRCGVINVSAVFAAPPGRP